MTSMLTSEMSLAEHPVLRGVEPEITQRLAGQARIVSVPAGAFIMAEDQAAETCWLVMRGSVRVFSSSRDGLEVTHQVLRAPAVLGAAEGLLGVPYAQSAQALEAAMLWVVPAAALLAAEAASPTLCRNLLRDAAGRLLVATHRQKTSALYAVAPQLAQTLCSFADAFGLSVAGGTQIRIPLTHIDLANTLGVAARSVARALKLWERDGLIAKRGRYLVLRDRERLLHLAECPALPMVYSSELPLLRWGRGRAGTVSPLRKRLAASA
jgi:CRP-like cAMP-binding protein